MEANLEELTQLQRKLILAFRNPQTKEIDIVFDFHRFVSTCNNYSWLDIYNAIFDMAQAGIVKIYTTATDRYGEFIQIRSELIDTSVVEHLEAVDANSEKPVLSLEIISAIIAQLSVNIKGVKPDISAVFNQVYKEQNLDQVKGLEFAKSLLRFYFNTEGIENAE